MLPSPKPVLRIIGLMSGTSVDGVDGALCELRSESAGVSVRILAQASEEMPAELRARILKTSEPAGAGTAEICALNAEIGELFARCARAVMRAAGAGASDVDAIGSHGQTVCHLPPAAPGVCGSTLQLGDAAVIAERTGVPVVSNFRPRDMAAGGQGAPLVPLADHVLFSAPDCTRIALNIGGIANVTVLPRGGGLDGVFAFDTGPGNMVIDWLVQHFSGGKERYDADGAWAARGRVCEDLLLPRLAHEYFVRTPPKSTGRELFGAAFAREFLDAGLRRGLTADDLVASATAFTARTIAAGVRLAASRAGTVDEIIVAGGGALNPVLMRAVKEALPGVEVYSSDRLGVPVMARECVAFAVLARQTILGLPGNVPAATGARGPRILGQMTPA